MTGKQFRDFRIRAGLTLRQCAEYLGWSQATIWRYEHSDEIAKCVEWSVGALDPVCSTLTGWILHKSGQEQQDIRRRQTLAALALTGILKESHD